MNRPRLPIKLLLLCALVVGVVPLAYGAGRQAFAPQSEQELYDTAKHHYEAGAYQKSLDIIEGLLKTAPEYAPAFFLKYKALMGLFNNGPLPPPPETNSSDARRAMKKERAKVLKQAADCLERFLQLKPDVNGADQLREQLNSLRVYAEPATKPESEWTVFSPADVTEKAHLLGRRTEPRYPEEARAARVSGEVRLLVVLAADGAVKHILVLESPSHWLTESSIEAARQLKFSPAVKDGHRVDTTMLIEYHFQTF